MGGRDVRTFVEEGGMSGVRARPASAQPVLETRLDQADADELEDVSHLTHLHRHRTGAGGVYKPLQHSGVSNCYFERDVEGIKTVGSFQNTNVA